MAKKKVKVEETAVEVLPEEVVVADVVNEEEPVDVVVEEEQDSLQGADTVNEEEKQEEIPEETVECDSVDPVVVDMNTSEEGTKQEEIHVDTVEEEDRQEDVSNDTEEGLQDSNESLSDNSEDKKIIPASTPVAYITERSGKTFTEATVINVLRGMINSGSILSLERGSYSIGVGTGLTSRLIQFIEVTRNNLEKVATISVSDIHEEDYKAISELKQLKETLNNMYERLASK